MKKLKSLRMMYDAVFCLIRFELIASENLNNILSYLKSISLESSVDEYGVISFRIKVNDEELSLLVSSYIDPSDMVVKLKIWGKARNESLVRKLEQDLGVTAKIRPVKPSLLVFAKKIIELSDRGIKNKDIVLQKIAEELGLDKKEIKGYLSLLKDAGKRRGAREEILKAYELLFS